jgi:hypothetical protein
VAWQTVRDFIDERIKVLGSILIITVVVLLVLSHYFHFVEDFVFKENLLSVILIVLMISVLDRLADLRPTAAEPSLRLSARGEVTAYLRQVPATRADLIFSSAHTIHESLEHLRDANCRIRLLIQHPKAAITPLQHRLIQNSMAALLEVTFRGYDKAELRCYSTPATIRGWCLDRSRVAVGLYTYPAGEIGLHGHTHVTFTARAHSAEGAQLVAWFEQVFDELWGRPDTVPAVAVYEEITGSVRAETRSPEIKRNPAREGG